MITSDRKFGFEVEFSCPTKQKLYNIGEYLRLTDDGSIRHIPFSAEFVSDVLQGSKGEKKVHYVCEILKKNGASGGNPAMSVHIHLDGRFKNLGFSRNRSLPATITGQTWGISNRVASMVGKEEVDYFVNNGRFNSVRGTEFYFTHFDGVDYVSLTNLTRKPKFNYTYYYRDEEARFKWLRNVFYFYTLYSQVMEDIVSNSRRFGNMYCIPLGESYNTEDIEVCKNMQELKSLWYKGRRSNGHYDDSRYHNVNLHCFWDRHGTVEIRSHGGTVDAHKILLWIKLHQAIVDKLETIDIDDIKSACNRDALHQSFVDFLDDDLLKAYVKRLMGYYSGISLK